MTGEPVYFGGALLTGLLGAGHCIGMCGPIVAALSLVGAQKRSVLFHVLYNVGRIITYVGIGALLGLAGSSFAATNDLQASAGWVLVVGDLFIILVGLLSATAGTRVSFMRLDFPGPTRFLTRAARGLRQLPPALAALPLGLIMGFLPCGFLYAVAVNAGLAADPWRGAEIMLGFGLGTAPSLLVMGAATQWLGVKARTWMIRGAGVGVAALGAYNLWRHLDMLGVL